MKRNSRNANLLFYIYVFPYSLLLICVIYLFNESAPSCLHDECGYLGLADSIRTLRLSLDSGYHLTWGPVWPLLLAGIKSITANLLFIRLLNSAFVILTLIFFRKVLRFFTPVWIATAVTILYSLYPLNIWDARIAWSESFFHFVLVYALYYYFYYLNDRKISILIFASFLLACVALTKPFYGYTMTFMIIAVPIFMFIFVRKEIDKWKFAAAPFLLSLIFCIPYLLFTFVQTGNIFYWGVSGGPHFYWMTYPQINNYGDMHFPCEYDDIKELQFQRDVLEEVLKADTVECDRILKNKALENLRNHPTIYIRNVVSNFGRLVFNFPHAFSPQTPGTLLCMVPNSFIFSFFVCSLGAIFLYRLDIKLEESILILFICTLFSSHLLISAVTRFFHPISMLMTVTITSTFSKLQKKHESIEVPEN